MGCLGGLISGAKERDNFRIDSKLVIALNEGLEKISKQDLVSE